MITQTQTPDFLFLNPRLPTPPLHPSNNPSGKGIREFTEERICVLGTTLGKVQGRAEDVDGDLSWLEGPQTRVGGHRWGPETV